MAGRPSVLRVVLAVVAIAALVTAASLAVIGRRNAHRASALRTANAAAVAHNRALSAEMSALTAANNSAQARIGRFDDDRRATVARLDALVGAWNAWLTANNGVIETANGFVDDAAPPSGSTVRTALDPRLRTVTEKEAAFRAAVARFGTAAARARRDSSSVKP